MRTLFALGFVAALGAGGLFAFPSDAAQPEAAKPTGKLVVLVVFDQMRGDYPDRWAAQYGPDGFERMKRDGAWYSECHIPYSCTSTGPGHVALVTGAPPRVNGITENDWYDRKAAARVYCAQPTRPFERVPPFVGKAEVARGAETGFSPEQVLCDTVGDVVRAHKGRVFSLSVKDRSAAMMGGKKPDGVYCFDNRDGTFHTGAYYRQDLHPWVEEFNASGLAKACLEKTWERFKPNLDYDALAGRDDAPGEGTGPNKTGNAFPHPMKGGPKSKGSESKAPPPYAMIETSPFGNELLFELTKKAIVAEKLGAGETTDLLCVGFSSNDLVGHSWGPDSHEVLDITLRSDALIAEFLKFLDEKVGKDRYTLVISADHGICPLPERKSFPTAQRVRLDTEVIPSLAKALDAEFKQTKTAAEWFLGTDHERLWPWLYVNRPGVEASGLAFEKVVDFTAQWVGKQPFVEMAFTRTQIEAGTPPDLGSGPKDRVKELFEAVRLAYLPERCGDLVVVQKPGVLITKYETGTSHGSPHAYDRHIPFIAYGAKVPKLGKRTERVSSLAIAPTLALALGVAPPATAKEPLPPGLQK